MKKVYTVFILLCILSVSRAQTLDGISPNSGYAGQQNLNTTITGTNLFQVTISPWGNIFEINLKQGANVIPVFELQSGMSFNVNVIDPQTATAEFSIPSNAATGLYDLELTTTDPFVPGTNLIQYNLPAAFTVNPPDGYLSGKVYRDVNENGIFDAGDTPMQNQFVSLSPGGQTITTDSNGDYSVGVENGNYTLNMVFAASHAYVVSSDSLSYNVSVNNSNFSNLDFGLVEGLLSIAPAVAFRGQTINSNVVSRTLFTTGANPSGNITGGYIRKNNSPFNQYSISTSSFVVLDSNNVQLVYQIPPTAATGTYDLAVRINNLYYFLPDGLTITLPPGYLAGKAFYDANNNAAYDSGEAPIPNVRFYLEPDSMFAFTDQNGDYEFGANLGFHILSFVSAPGAGLMLTTQASYTFTNTGTMTGLDFGFRSSLPDYSASVQFIPGFMRCFQNVASTVKYTNTSNVQSQGFVYIIHSSNTTFSSSSPAHSHINADTVFWNFSGLDPMETRTITVNFVNPGTGSISFITGIHVEDGSGVQQYHDEKTFSATVLCAYDPNDKAATPEGVDDVMHYTLINETLDYLIRFQNTGNDTAFTVYIRDTIDVSLDISTFEVLASSHSVQTTIDSNRAVVFLYENILLADSVVDEPNSHGFVKYRISPLPNLPDPTRIENTAYIYFDFNPAVVTNTTWNTMVLNIPVGISENIRIDEGLRFYPNPMGDFGYFSIDNPDGSLIRLEMYDMRGKLVRTMESKTELLELKRGELSSGLYLIRLIHTGKGKVSTGKISLK